MMLNAARVAEAARQMESREASAMKMLLVITQGTESKTMFPLLLFAFCLWTGFGLLFLVPGPEMVVLCGVWILVLRDICTRILSWTSGAAKSDVMHRGTPLSMDQVRHARNLGAALGMFGLLLTVSIVSHLLNGAPWMPSLTVLQWVQRVWEHALLIVLGIGAFLAVQLTMSSHRRVHAAILTIVFLVLISSLFVLYDAFTGSISVRASPPISPDAPPRFSGLAASVSILALHLSLALPMVLSLLLYVLCQRRWWWSLALTAAMVVLLLAMVLNATRSTLLGSTAGFALVAVFFVLHIRLGLFARTIAVLAITMIPLCTTGIMASAMSALKPGPQITQRAQPILPSPPTTSRQHRLFTVTDHSAQARILQIKLALHHVLENGKLLGEAPRKEFDAGYVSRVLGLEENDPAILWIANLSMHNDFMEVLVLYGPIGLALLLAFWLTVARAGLHSCILVLQEKELRATFLAASTLGCLLSMFVFWNLQTTGPFTPHQQGWASYFVVGLVFAIERILSERRAAAAGC